MPPLKALFELEFNKLQSHYYCLHYVKVILSPQNEHMWKCWDLKCRPAHLVTTKKAFYVHKMTGVLK
jgi:hypothetical protein